MSGLGLVDFGDFGVDDEQKTRVDGRPKRKALGERIVAEGLIDKIAIFDRQRNRARMKNAEMSIAADYHLGVNWRAEIILASPSRSP